MNELQHININDFDYDLPDEKIAKFPLSKRDSSKLLVRRNNKISQDLFRNISDHLPKNSLLVFNNTKVINARMHFKKETGAVIEVFCLEPMSPVDYSISLASNKSCSWKCLVGNNKKWKEGSLKKVIEINKSETTVSITKLAQVGNSFEILFEWNNSDIHFSDILEISGNIPIPPYLNRDSQEIDKKRYQTIYSELDGSVAAPTAGLHFTDKVLADLSEKNIKTESVTLHVGAGTFHPVKSDLVSEHDMHTEHFIITKQNIENLIKHLGNITVVGTTSVRTLESTYQVAKQISLNPEKKDNAFLISQWSPYDLENPNRKIQDSRTKSQEPNNKSQDSKDKIQEVRFKEKESNCKSQDSSSDEEILKPKTQNPKPDEGETRDLLTTTLEWMNMNNFSQLNCATQIMILPGYEFKFTNRLITNFHQPKSTLLLLLSAFIGESWKEVYDYAKNNDFRFLSYGDSSLFFDK